MALIPEWERRIEIWRKELKNYFYTALGPLSLQYFTTQKHLHWREALKNRFKTARPGVKWGKYWEYGWFKGTVVLPASAAGKRIVVRPEPGGESLVIVNGKHAGLLGWVNKDITLARSGRKGGRFDILLEAYAGHGFDWTKLTAGPIARGGLPVKRPLDPQAVVGHSSFGVWEEEVFQLWLDVETLWGIRQNIDPASLRAGEIDRGLRDFTTIVDFEVSFAEFLLSVARARRRLAPLMQARNGSTSPLMHCFGHAHLDVAWLWPLAETERKVARTFANQLSLIAEYPEYRFLQSEPHLYMMLKERHPDLFQRVRQAIRRGKVIADGGMWVEADTNITGGESLIRQFIHGKGFFHDEFGVDNEVLWLPDVFGYTGSLPQIMKGCGMRYFSTQKILWNYNGGEPFPYNTFQWEGIDGTQVLSHIFNDYNATTDSAKVISQWNNRVQKDGVSRLLMSFGWGDGGGGPHRDHLEYVRRNADLEGVPRMKYSSPREFFREVERVEPPANRYVGELYFQAHRGTYTTQARTKRGNRKAEFALREAEMWGTVASALGMAEPAEKTARPLWREVLLNQFHDIIPGSSITRVYKESEKALARVLKSARSLAEKSAKTLAGRGDGLAVFNSLSWNRTGLAELPKGWKGATDASGSPLPVQASGGRVFAEVTAPSCGWTSLHSARGGAPAGGKVFANAREIDNGLIRIRLNDRGEVTHLRDLKTGREVLAGPSNRLMMWKDVPRDFDAWDIDRTYLANPVPLPEKAVFLASSSGPLFGSVSFRRRIGSSLLEQEVFLRRGSRVVEFRTRVDWRERRKLLKVGFTPAIIAEDAIHEIQYGHLRRPTHESRTYDADRFEVACQKWTALAEEGRGFAVMNDCKYGVSVRRNTIGLSLLRSTVGPDEEADQGRHEFTYAMTCWNGPLTASGIVRRSYELNQPLLALPGGPGSASLFAVDGNSVVIDAVKEAEDASGDIIVRLYESMRTATACRLSTSLPVRKALETDMMERNGKPLRMAGDGIALDFRAFEIKTVRLRLG